MTRVTWTPSSDDPRLDIPTPFRFSRHVAAVRRQVTGCRITRSPSMSARTRSGPPWWSERCGRSGCSACTPTRARPAGISPPTCVRSPRSMASAGTKSCRRYPGDAVTHRILELPFHDRKRLDQTVPFELESHLPFELDETVVDFQVLRTRADGTQRRARRLGAEERRCASTWRRWRPPVSIRVSSISRASRR